MQDFEENVNIPNPDEGSETLSESMFEGAPESTPENVPNLEQSQEIPQPEASETPPETLEASDEQPEHFEQEGDEPEDSQPNPRQTQTRNYYTPALEDDSKSNFEPEKIEVSTVSKENVVLGEVLDKKYDEMVTVQPVRFASFDDDKQIAGPPRKNLDIMQDVGIRLTVELGRTRMKVRKLLDIAKGSIIEIDKMAGDQAELFVCGKLVARGEVIVIEDKFGLRIASIVEQKED